MGKGRLILKPDSYSFDLDEHFPAELKHVCVMLSGGVESTILAYLLTKFYGVQNVVSVSGVMKERRYWEHKNAERISNLLGIRNITIENNFKFMGPEEVSSLAKGARKMINFDGIFNGASKLWFNPTRYNVQTAALLKTQGMHLPFIDLQKQHVIDIYRQYNQEDLLYSTHSCTAESNFHCGMCTCCFERHKGFLELVDVDLTLYKTEEKELNKMCLDEANYRKTW